MSTMVLRVIAGVPLILAVPMRSNNRIAGIELETDACQSVSKWETLYTATTMSGKHAKIKQTFNISGQPWFQHFYTVSCFKEGSQCESIQRSRCVNKNNFVPAIVEDEDGKIDWDMVAVPGQCVCKIIKKFPYID